MRFPARMRRDSLPGSHALPWPDVSRSLGRIARAYPRRWTQVYAARRIKPDIQIWYHSDGNITDIIPELIEIEVTTLNPLQPECIDVAEMKKKYGKHLVFDGTVGTQSTMPFGSPEEVKRVIRENKKNYGGDGGLILSPTHVLEPEVPVKNILAFVDACKEEGGWSW